MRRVIDKLRIMVIIAMALVFVVPLPVQNDWSNAPAPAMVTGAGG